MAKKRLKFSREFKIEAVRMVTEGGRGTAETARELGINPTVLTRWKQQLSENGDKAFPGKGGWRMRCAGCSWSSSGCSKSETFQKQRRRSSREKAGEIRRDPST